MQTRRGCWGLLIFVWLALAACSPILPPTVAVPESPLTTLVPTPADNEADNEEEMMNQPQNEIVALAQADLAARLSIATDQIAVREVRQVTWPDASLGCKQPSQMVAQVLQPGWLIQLAVGEQMYFYHSGEAQRPFLCENSPFLLPRGTPKTDERVPPPDRDVK
jgi:hypothetical protein